MKPNKPSSNLVKILIAVLILVLIAAVGWLIYDLQNSNDDKNTTGSTNQTEQTNPDQENKKTEEESSYKTLELASSKVQFEIPKSWTVEKKDCTRLPRLQSSCIERTNLVPAEKMPTIYGGGTEYFTIYTDVYENKDNKSAQRWFEDVYQGSLPTASDKTSSENINGYDTYYFRQVSESYDEISYVYTANNKAVLVTARVTQKSIASDGSGRVNNSADFTQYIPEIEKMAKSISIN